MVLNPRRRNRMLCISRRNGEQTILKLPDGTLLGTVKVVGVTGNRVKLGFDMCDAVRISRDDAKSSEPNHERRKGDGHE
jgi:sRNA-binding carbon storage regulator CsrA